MERNKKKKQRNGSLTLNWIEKDRYREINY